MPKHPVNYDNTIIYKLVCRDLSVKDVYVGHTTDFKNRKNQHKNSCNNEKAKDYNNRKYEIIREHGGWKNWEMVEIEKFPCKDSNEATARERYFYDKLQSSLNTYKPQINDDDNILRKCLCGYETRRNDNFVRHLKRKTTWCDEVMVSAVIETNADERTIIFYYKMINTKKDFAIWMRNIRRVNQQFINIRDSDTQIEKGDTQIEKGNNHIEKGDNQVENTPIMKEINDSPIQNIPNAKRLVIRMPYPGLDFLIWTKRMTYVTVDIRDTTGEFMWDGTYQTSKEMNNSIINKYKTEHTTEINKYIDGIKRFFKIGERYVIEIPLEKLNIPIFFYIKQINEENIIIDYVKIDFLKIGTGEATIAPLWDEIKQERIINNKDIINIYPFDEHKRYRYNCYCYIRNDVRTFYEIVNKR